MDDEGVEVTVHNIKGRTIDGFEILEKFAGGAFSSVHFAHHILTDSYCAVKIIDLGAQSDKGFCDIMREVSCFMQIRHPNICSLFRLSVVNKILLFFMEYAEHGTLLQYVNHTSGLKEVEANRIFKQLFSALIHIHFHHFLVHRDLKLENVLLDRDNNVKLIDFGLASTFYCNVLKSFAGTPGYMPPEIVAGNEYGEPCDVWSLGVCLYCMLCGSLPFTAQSHDYHSLVDEAARFQPPPNVSPACADLLKKMLVPRPDHRITFSQIQGHPWMRGLPMLPGNISPKPIVFYQVTGYKDILKFKRIPLNNPDPDLVAQCATMTGTEEETVKQMLSSGQINEVTTVYFILVHPLRERPTVPEKPRLPPLIVKMPRRKGNSKQEPPRVVSARQAPGSGTRARRQSVGPLANKKLSRHPPLPATPCK